MTVFGIAGLNGQILIPQPGVLEVRTAATDQLGNLYVANIRNEVFKQDPAGKLIGYYSNNQLGFVGIIDATSPMKVLVFYPAFNTGVVLDRRLLETSRFNLIEMGFGQIELVAFSRDGTLWIFDDHEQRLYKVDQSGNILRKGDDLRLVFDQRLQPSKMIEAGGFLYMAVPQRGIVIFDLFGQYKSQMLRPEIIDFQIIEDQSLVYVSDGELIVVPLQIMTMEEKRYILPDGYQNAKMVLSSQELMAVSPDGVIRLPLSVLLKK